MARKIWDQNTIEDKIYILLHEVAINIEHFEGKESRLSDQILYYLDKMKTVDLGHVTCSQIAVTFGYSISHLSKMFKFEQGVNLKDILLSIKMGRAYNMLKYSLNKPKVRSLSKLLGFQSINHFRKAFKERYGYPPGRLP